MIPENQRYRGPKEGRELNQVRSKPDPVDRPARTDWTVMHHYNGMRSEHL